MARLDTFLRVAVDQRASDMHFHAGSPPLVRYNGQLIPMPFRELTAPETQRFLEEILEPEQKTALARDLQIDFAYRVEDVGRFRVNVFRQSGGLGAVFRHIVTNIPTVEELGLPSVVAELAHQSQGLVLFTGPTGSGKSTSLAALVQEMNATTQRHIITIEDPIEYLHEPKQSIITQREVGNHVVDFATALRSTFRETPDVVVVGEMRDFETISLALSAAETGVLVFGTLHTNTAAKAVDRIIAAAPVEVEGQVRGVLSVLLRGVVAQRLCRLASGDGRIAAVEVLLGSHAVSHLIRENKIFQIESYLRSGQDAQRGMRCLEASLAELVGAGLIDEHEAMRAAPDPGYLKQLVARFHDPT